MNSFDFIPMNHYTYHVADPIDSRFAATASVNEGELLLDIRVELESGERSTVLRGPDQLRKILAHFVPRYQSVRVCWSYGDNLTDFNRATAVGATADEAALRTWTGHQLALAGYSHVSIQSVEGTTGRFTKVTACFRKP
jgi:hypothetical protein